MEALENYKGEIYAYNYNEVTIRVTDSGYSLWKSNLGFSLFAEDNVKWHFLELETAKQVIDDLKPVFA